MKFAFAVSREVQGRQEQTETIPKCSEQSFQVSSTFPYWWVSGKLDACRLRARVCMFSNIQNVILCSLNQFYLLEKNPLCR